MILPCPLQLPLKPLYSSGYTGSVNPNLLSFRGRNLTIPEHPVILPCPLQLPLKHLYSSGYIGSVNPPAFSVCMLSGVAGH